MVLNMHFIISLLNTVYILLILLLSYNFPNINWHFYKTLLFHIVNYALIVLYFSVLNIDKKIAIYRLQIKNDT